MGSPVPWSFLDDARDAPSGRRLPRDQVTSLLAGIEQQVKASPDTCFTQAPDGSVKLAVDDRTYHAGRFETPTLRELLARAGTHKPGGHVRLSLLSGDSAVTDIGTLQAIAPPGTLFQAASQFNCLESPGPYVVAVHEYTGDPTQGPRASVSAFPGTFLRHYFAPRVDLLADALAGTSTRVQDGYLMADAVKDPDATAAALEDRFHDIRIGLHDDVEVVLGHNWGGAVPGAPDHRIAQVFTSTIALGMYSSDRGGSPAFATIRQQLLRAAYLGTLLGAIVLGKRRVVLTLIGGGVFGNPHRSIWDAIHWAAAEAAPYAEEILDVIVNARTDHVAAEDLDRVTGSGGRHLAR